MSDYTTDAMHGGGMRMARTRGLASGMLLLVLGAWAAVVPFVGNYLDFAYTPTSTWTWTSGRGWYEVAPGAAAFFAGLVLLLSANRVVTSCAAWLGIAGGAWLVIGPQLATYLDVGSIGTPTGTTDGVVTLERLFYFDAIGTAIVLVAAIALGRLSIRSVGDVRAARRRQAVAVESGAAEGAATRSDVPLDPAPARTTAGPAAPTAPAATAAPAAGAARGDANGSHHRHFHLMRRHGGHETQPTAYSTETQPQPEDH